MALHKAKPKETVAEYKVRLRRTAMNLPQSMVKNAVPNIQVRAKQVMEAEGGDIPRD